jgi:hypothetical protein
MDGTHACWWQVGQSEKALRQTLHGKWRNQLCRAEALGLSVRVATAPERSALIRNEAASRRPKGYRYYPPTWTEGWLHWGESLTLVVCHPEDGSVLASAMALCHGQSATYHLAHSGPEGRKHHAMNLLLWQMALRLRAQGIHWFDLGFWNKKAAPGLSHFKQGTGAKIWQRPGVFCRKLWKA